MKIGLKDKVVMVTGGLRGIGEAITKSCAYAGAKVIATYFSNNQSAQKKISSLREEGLDVHGYCVDVRDGKSIDEFISMVEQEFGGLDVLINNAGIIKDNLLLAMEDSEWNDVLATNLSGVFNVTRSAARVMLKARKGNIINLSSMAASKPGRGHCNYAASKGGIESMTKALAVELGGKGIRVNCVAPGVIATDMSRDVREAAGDRILENIVLRRFGTPQDVANAVVFLAADVSSYITGEVLHINGGLKN